MLQTDEQTNVFANARIYMAKFGCASDLYMYIEHVDIIVAKYSNETIFVVIYCLHSTTPHKLRFV